MLEKYVIKAFFPNLGTFRPYFFMVAVAFKANADRFKFGGVVNCSTVAGATEKSALSTIGQAVSTGNWTVAERVTLILVASLRRKDALLIRKGAMKCSYLTSYPSASRQS